MLSFALFAFSGVAIIALTLSKRFEERQREKKGVFILKLISRTDEHVRHFHHEALLYYTHGKDKFAFWFKKQMPLKAKSLANKSVSYLQEKTVKHLGNIRNSRHIKKSDGISEFFKNISDIEKGNGELHDEVYTEPTAPTPEVVPEPVLSNAIETSVTTEPPVKKKRSYTRRKKVKVIEAE